MDGIHESSGAQRRVECLIVGAGFGGLCTAIRLKQRGVENFVVLETASDVGGTWEANTYPGCACDVQSHLYSFSFEPNPDWSRVFSPQPEIWDYLRRCVDRYGLRQHLRLGTSLSEARFDEGSDEWRVVASDGGTWRARILVVATGGLSVPALPSIPGREQFAGESFHSARWPGDVELSGRRVAVIGTGASAIQIVPAIAEEAASVHLFQRSPPWILPRGDRRITRTERRLFRRVPLLRRLYRALLYLKLESRAFIFTVWPALTRLVAAMGRWHIRRSVADPSLRARLVPDYPPGCKRVLLSDDFYPTLERDNVTLVPLAAREITRNAVVAADGSAAEVDTIVYATGFQATSPIPPGLIIGRDGVDLTERWRDGAEAYKGMAVSGFPNLFILMGPNTALGHNSVVFMIEAQVHYLMRALTAMRTADATRVEVRPEVEAGWNERLQRRLARTVWSSDCRSWYKDARGRIVTLWPGFTVEYWLRTRHFDAPSYEFSSRPARVAAPRGSRAA
jgi:cation diffusion facilitator CzcD-associated flavoprotein CzcO